MAAPRGRVAVAAEPWPRAPEAGTAVTLPLSIIVPVLNEAATIADCLAALQPLRESGAEVLVVDGGSDDGTAERAAPLADRVLIGERGRARQMNLGAARARGTWLLFLHADTRLEFGGDTHTLAECLQCPAGWGFFDLRLSGATPIFRLIAGAINVRSRVSGVGTGDQALFVERERFRALGGFPEIPLMEDVAFSKRMRRAAGRPGRTGLAVVSSSRRWERGGVARTVLLMWWLRWLYFIGVSPTHLHRRYYP